MVEAEKVEPDLALADVTDAGFVRMRTQPDSCQRLCGQLTGRDGLLLGRAHNYEIVGLCRIACYEERGLGSVVWSGFRVRVCGNKPSVNRVGRGQRLSRTAKRVSGGL